jgi:hypothetical protein
VSIPFIGCFVVALGKCRSERGRREQGASRNDGTRVNKGIHFVLLGLFRRTAHPISPVAGGPVEHGALARRQHHARLRVLPGIKRLDDCSGDFLVRMVCECGACREIQPQALVSRAWSAGR